MNNLRIGLLGLGNMGKNHLRVLSMIKGVSLDFIYDLNNDLAKSLAEQCQVRATFDLEQDIKNVDAVVIATPTNTHYEYLLLASKYVKNIFIEKPVTDNLNTALKLQKVVNEKKLNLQVGYIERFNPAVMELKKILSRSKKVINIDFTRTNKLSNRITDVDVILDLMIHDIDLSLYFNGPVKDVFTYGYTDNGLTAFACAILKHDNDCYSKITASRITEKRMRSIYATCDNMFVDCNLLRKEIFINKQTILQSYQDIKVASMEETVSVSNQEALLSELIVFVKNSLNEEIDSCYSVPDINSAIESMKIADIIQKQIWSSGK